MFVSTNISKRVINISQNLKIYIYFFVEPTYSF